MTKRIARNLTLLIVLAALFAMAGCSCKEYEEQIMQLDAQVAELQQELSDRDAKIAEREQVAEDLQNNLANLENLERSEDEMAILIEPG